MSSNWQFDAPITSNETNLGCEKDDLRPNQIRGMGMGMVLPTEGGGLQPITNYRIKHVRTPIILYK